MSVLSWHFATDRTKASDLEYPTSNTWLRLFEAYIRPEIMALESYGFQRVVELLSPTSRCGTQRVMVRALPDSRVHFQSQRVDCSAVRATLYAAP